MNSLADEESYENLANEIDQIIEDIRSEEQARRRSKAKPKIPTKYLNVDKYTAVTAEEYMALCDRRRHGDNREILVIEPIDAFAYIDHLLPAHIVGIDQSGTSLELYRHRQESLTGIHTLGKITAHACTFDSCSLSADGDKDNMGIYLSDCRSKQCRLQSPAECKIGGGKFDSLEVESHTRIEIISSMAEKLKLFAPECHVELRASSPSHPCSLKLQAEHATLHGTFSSITGSAETLVLPLASLSVWQGVCLNRKIVMTPLEFVNHLNSPHPQVRSSDAIRVSGTGKQVLVLEDQHSIGPETEILTNVDISRRRKPWNHPVRGILFVSREYKQEINAPCQAIRLTGSSTNLSPDEYRQWQPLASSAAQNLDLELF